MRKIIFLPFIFLIWSCKSTIKNDKTKLLSDTVKLISKKDTLNIGKEAKQAVSNYDTLVFQEHMKGAYLEDKFILSESKLQFYKKFINPKKLIF
jgi:hypothetical protein